MCIATFVNWSENSIRRQHLQFSCCSVSPGTGGPSQSVHFDSVRIEKKISIMSPAWTFIRSPAEDIHGYCNCLCWQRDIISHNRIHFHILNSNFQNLINKQQFVLIKESQRRNL